ncbi:hypothetical protein DY000_02052779 [Brassica cretica]|uniref:Tafazzin family protein n=1 Tax=Brassica cretica TaxID=69181 RepID=A0ABQ7AGS9_BRACR|nr:hypothetical protein DY000_02052779 [Brassica cretica]
MDRPASSTMTRASSPGEHDRVAGRLAGELGRDTSQLARRARSVWKIPWIPTIHVIPMKPACPNDLVVHPRMTVSDFIRGQPED